MNVSVKVGSVPRNPISPFIYGNFMEFIERHISGMRAEMLQNRHFADVKPEKSMPEFWEISGYNNVSECFSDEGARENTKSLRLLCAGDNGGYTGVSQRGIAVKKGKRYTGYVYLKKGGEINAAEVLVGKDYGAFFIAWAGTEIKGLTEGFVKYPLELFSDSEDDDAVFTVRFKGEGTLWVCHPSLMPEDHMFGWRKDVTDLVKELKPNIIRFPGGCFADTYHWKNAVGDRDFRTPGDNYFWSDIPFDFLKSHIRTPKHRRLTEPNDAGIDEFAKFCEMTAAEALLCVNAGSGTPEEAADWVEYCNGGPDTEYGKLRAENGRAEPYNIKYWEIGNEMYGSYETGYSGLDGYIERFMKFQSAMKAKDPTIKLIINGYDSPWNRAVLRHAGENADYIDIHCYPGFALDPKTVSIQEMMQSILLLPRAAENQINALREDIAAENLTGKVKAGVCEYNVSGGGWGPTRAYMSTQAAALFNASLLHIFIRNSDLVKMANISNLTNAWWSSCIRTDNARCHVTASYHVLSMFSNFFGDAYLPSSYECGGDNSSFDVVASLDGKENAAVVSIINKTGLEGVSAKISFETFTPEGRAEVIALWSESLESLNDFSSPDRIKPTRETVDAPALNALPIKPYSLTLVRVKIKSKA